MLCQFAIIPFVGTVCVGGVLCKILMNSHSPREVLSWYAVLVAFSALRAWIARQFMRGPRSVAHAYRCARISCVSAAASGFTWAYAVVFLLPSDTTDLVIVILFYLAAVASGLATLSPIRCGYPSLLLPFLLPFAVAQFVIGGANTAVAYGVLLYVLMLLYISRTYRHGIREMLLLRLANEELAQHLSEERNSIAAINEDLKRQIAERKQVETQLRAAKVEAEAASRAKSQFLANLSHEVRTPMNAVLGMTQLLSRTRLNSRQQHFAQVALESGQALLHLIDDMLDLSRIEAGKLALHAGEFSPRKWVQEVLELMAPQAAMKEVQLTKSIGEDVPDTLCGDEHRLRQVLVNLVSNAIKFTERGSVAVELTVAGNVPAARSDRASTQVKLRCCIRDTGIGIAEEAHSRLFNPFSQADESTTRRFGGSGLGLAISRQVIEAMDGKIGFESNVGEGSLFWFEVTLAAPEVERASETAVATGSAKLSGRVLVVEDNAVNRSLLAEMLALLGLKVSMAENGAQALALLERQSFDVVFMDWHMPQVDGIEAARRIRAREAESLAKGAKPAVIIALTASAMPGDSESCLAAGMNGYIAKPFMFDEILDVLQRNLPQAASRVA